MSTKDLKNKRKTLTCGKDEEYSIDFINEGSKLKIIAKKESDILSIIYSSTFSLEDIKKFSFFGNDYESIDDCLDEIFDKLEKRDKDENKTVIEKKDSELITITISKFSKRCPTIYFTLKKQEKNDNEKYDELLDIVVKMKKNQENEIKKLQNKINYYENLLKIKKNPDFKKGLDEFKGSVIEMSCFGPNEIENYFDLNQDYIYSKKDESTFISFVFTCKDEKDMPSAVETFKKVKENYSYKENIFIRTKGNKAYIEYRYPYGNDLFEINGYDLSSICFSSGQSLIIKTDAIPKNFYEEYNKEKILNLVLGTELEFENLSPQIQLCVKSFILMAEELRFPEYLQRFFKDIFLNVLNGNYKYKVSKLLLKDEENEIKEIYDGLQRFFNFIVELFNYEYYKDYKKINYDEIEFNLMSARYKSGFNYKFKLPYFNELMDELIKKKFNQ